MGINLPNCKVTARFYFPNRKIFRNSDTQLNLLYTRIMFVIVIELILAFRTQESIKLVYDNNFAYGDFNPPLTAFRIGGANGGTDKAHEPRPLRNVRHHSLAGLTDLVRPHLEANQCIRAEGMGDGHVSRVAPLRD